MDTAHLVLEYLKVFLSGPAVAGATTLLLASMFRSEVRTLIGRIAHIKLPGGGELSTSQQEKTQEALPEARQAPLLPPAEANVALPVLPAVPEADAARIEQLIRSERANAILWEYRYLNSFLARGTQIVLDWLEGRPPMSVRQFDAEVMALIDDANERAAIYRALTNHHLVRADGDLLEVTPKGRDYISWRGPLPPLKSEQPALPPKE